MKEVRPNDLDEAELALSLIGITHNNGNKRKEIYFDDIVYNKTESIGNWVVVVEHIDKIKKHIRYDALCFSLMSLILLIFVQMSPDYFLILGSLGFITLIVWIVSVGIYFKERLDNRS